MPLASVTREEETCFGGLPATIPKTTTDLPAMIFEDHLCLEGFPRMSIAYDFFTRLRRQKEGVMKKFAFISVLMFCVVTAGSPVALAKEVKGLVAQVVPRARTITVVDRQPERTEFDLYTVDIQDDTQLKGMNSLDELAAGDHIRLEGNKFRETFRKNGIKVQSIEDTKVLEIIRKNRNSEGAG